VRAIRSGRKEVTPAFDGRMLLLLNRFAAIDDWMMGRYGKNAERREKTAANGAFFR